MRKTLAIIGGAIAVLLAAVLIYAWQGNGEVGQGRMEITDAAPSRVAMDLDFVKPFEAHNKVVFTKPNP